MSEKDLIEKEFFGYTRGRFCAEIHAVSYNEFLSVVKMMKERLEQVRKEICTHYIDPLRLTLTIVQVMQSVIIWCTVCVFLQGRRKRSSWSCYGYIDQWSLKVGVSH